MAKIPAHLRAKNTNGRRGNIGGNGQTPNMAMPCDEWNMNPCPQGFYATILRGQRGMGIVGSCYCTPIAQPRPSSR